MREYQKYEFCKSVGCMHLVFSDNDQQTCLMKNIDCLFTAKTFHKWLISNNFKLIKYEWTPVIERLPMDDIFEMGIYDQFLVTVELKNPDPNDDPEVMILWFDTTSRQFKTELGGKPYSEDHDWHVTAWMPLVPPYKKVI